MKRRKITYGNTGLESGWPRILADRTNAAFTDSSVYWIDVASAKTTELTPHTGNVLYRAAAISPDSKAILLSSNEKVDSPMSLCSISPARR